MSSGIEGWVGSRIGERVPDIKGAINLAKLSSGLSPVYRVETCKKLTDPRSRIGDRVIVDTFPSWVKFSTTSPDTGGILGTLKKIGRAVIDQVNELRGSQEKAQLLGIMVDEGFTNTYHFWANLIFQDVLVQSPKGNEWFSENVIEDGYPIRVYFGFVDPYGNVIQHPYEGPIATSKALVPDFTGFVTASTKEIYFPAGDRFQITCVGFEYMLRKTSLELIYSSSGGKMQFPAGTPLKEVLADMLRKMAVGVGATFTFASASKRPKSVPPGSFMNAMGVVGKMGTTLAPTTVQRNIQFVDVDSNIKVPRDIDFPTNMSGRAARMGVPSLLDVIAHLASDEYCNVEIFFDHYGRLTVLGKDFSTLDIAYGVTPKPKKKDKRQRVHDAVIGSNVIHAMFHTELDHTNVFDVFRYPESISAAAPKPVRSKNTGKAMSSEASAYFNSLGWGMSREFLIRSQAELSLVPQVEFTGKDDIAERYKYFGMRGAMYMIGQPKIRIGDILRVTDIRNKIGFGGNTDVVINLGKSMVDRVQSAIRDTFSSVGKTRKRITKDLRYLGLKGIEDVYYVWKVRHYVGMDGYDTKVFFVKEPQSLIPQGEMALAHKQFREKMTKAAETKGAGSTKPPGTSD